MTALGGQLKRLGKHSAIYGLGGLVSRILAVFLLPLYTRYLSPSDYGEVETLDRPHHRARDPAPARDLERVLPLLLRLARSRGPPARPPHLVLVHHGDGDARAARRSSSASPAISEWLFDSTSQTELVARLVRRLWARMNYAQVTALFRVEERSVAFVTASVANILLTVGATLLLVVALDRRAARRDRRQLHRHAHRLRRARRVPARAARSPVRPASPAPDEPVRAAARPERGLPVGDQLRRSLLPREADEHARGRPLLGRRAHRVRDGPAPDRLPRGLAGVRLLDRRRAARRSARTRSSSPTSS